MRNTKSRISDLAIFGGSPMFDEKLFIGRPNIGDREKFIQYVNDILDNRYFTNNGPYVKELENKLKQYLKVKYCIAVCNATVGIELAIKALELTGEIIVPSFTFIATVHAIQWLGLRPVFCDIDPRTHNIDPSNIERLINEKTSAIIGVHLWGRLCKTDEIERIARKYNINIIYDSAHSFGCSNGEGMAGGFGDAEVFSFHATKFFNTFEGGAITTNNELLADRISKIRNFGFVDYDQVKLLGTNAKMNEISAAMGIAGLSKLDYHIQINHNNYMKYYEMLIGLPGIRIVEYDINVRSNYQYVYIEIDCDITGITRDEIMKVLWEENIIVRRYFYPGCHKMEPYKSLYTIRDGQLEYTEKVCREILLLPTGETVTQKMIEDICHLIVFILSNGREIKRKLLI